MSRDESVSEDGGSLPAAPLARAASVQAAPDTVVADAAGPFLRAPTGRRISFVAWGFAALSGAAAWLVIARLF